MKRLVVILAVVMAAAVALAADAAPAKKPRRITPEMKAKMMARSGGMVVVRSKGPQFTFVNAQTRVPSADLGKVPGELERVLRFPFALVDRKLEGCALDAVPKLMDFSTAALIAVVDDKRLPAPSLMAIEKKWALVNVAELAADKPPSEVLAARVRKEMWRVFAILMGGANTQMYGCLLNKSVFSVEELDALPHETVSPQPMQAVCRTLDRLGMTRNRAATYRRAFIEGWAPPPETDAQRRIVEEETARKQKTADAEGK